MVLRLTGQIGRFLVYSPTAVALGFQSLKRRPNSCWKTGKVSWGDSYGVNKLLDGKRSFRKPDYHYTTIFLASWNPIITTLRYFGPEPHYRYSTICCVYVYVFVYVYISVFVYVYVYHNEIYDIGTNILCKTCFGHNSTQNERKSTIFGQIFTEFYVDSESSIKMRFKTLFKNWPSWIRC